MFKAALFFFWKRSKDEKRQNWWTRPFVFCFLFFVLLGLGLFWGTRETIENIYCLYMTFRFGLVLIYSIEERCTPRNKLNDLKVRLNINHAEKILPFFCIWIKQNTNILCYKSLVSLYLWILFSYQWPFSEKSTEFSYVFLI